MYINGTSIAELCGGVLRDFNVQAAAPTNTYFKGKNRTSFRLLTSILYFKTITCDVIFEGADRRDCSLKKSKFEGLCYGKNELHMPDGFFYTVMTPTAGAVEWVAEQGLKTQYTFEGIQHDRAERLTGAEILCRSTIPMTDCKLEFTVSSAAEAYTITVNDALSYSVENVSPGDVITIDGINGILSINGVPSALKFTWVRFPHLSPGLNSISAPDIPTVTYYPTYM